MASASTPKTVLITGCSLGGIGDALAQCFHRRSLRVFATARDLSKMQHLKEMGITVLSLDVTDIQSINRAVESFKDATGRGLDILVNNAGVGYSSPILDADLEYTRIMMEVNFFSRVAVTQAFAPLLIESKGTILNIGSIAGVYPSVWQGMYGASCAATNHWSDTLRNEMEPFGVRVILVVTGAVRTHFIDNLPTTQLIPGSLYSPAKEEIEAVMDTRAVRKNFVGVVGYAEQVVDNVLKSTPRKRQWAGGVATLVWMASTFLWATGWDLLMADQWGLKALKSRLQSKVNF